MDTSAENEKRKSNPPKGRRQGDDAEGISILDGLRIVVGLLLISCIASYFYTGDSATWGYRPWWLRPSAIAAKLRSPVVLTEAELLAYNGVDESLPIYLAVNGTIYDVSGGAGRRIYSPDGPYHFFAGHDATRGYITGCFKDDSVPDYRGVEWTFVPKDVPHYTDMRDADLSPEMRDYRSEMVGKGLEEVDKTIEHWAKTFRGETGKDYFEVGYVKREENWMDELPLLPLCASAEKKRPKGKFDKDVKYKKSERAERVRKAYARYAKYPKSSGEQVGASISISSKGHDEI